MNLRSQRTTVTNILTHHRPSGRGIAVFSVKNTGKLFLGLPILGEDARTHFVCGAAAIICIAHGGVKDLRKHELHFTRNQNGPPLEPCLFLRIMVQSGGQQLSKLK